jgi:hypothetical protein
MGYDSCPMIGFDIEKVAGLINLPEDHVMGPMVAIAKGIKDLWPKPGQLSLKTVFDGSDINQFDNYLTIVTIISR